MTDRGRARHRAPSRATTPLSTLTTNARTGLQHAAEGGADLIGRGGVAVVLSTGLVAATALTMSTLPLAGGSSAQDPTVTLDPAAASLTSFDRGVVNPQAISRGGATTVASGADAVQRAVESRAAARAKERADRAAARQAALASATASASPVQRVAPRPTRTAAQPATTTARTTVKKTAPVKKTATVKKTAPAVKKAAPAVKKATTTTTTAAAPTTSSARGSSVLAIASRYVGIPYRFGGTTPSGFDCSGYTQYVFRQVGINLPRTSQEQFAASTRISRSQARPGDLVFVGGLGHVGIYAGNNMMYDSPRSGKSVSKRAIWTSNARFGRV